MKTRLMIFYFLICGFFFGHAAFYGQQINDFLVNEHASPDGSEQEMPYIDGDGEGNYVIAWMDKRNGSNFDIYAQIINEEGSFEGENFKVNDDSYFAPRYDPSVAVAPDRSFMIVWLDKSTGEWNVFGRLFSAGGEPAGGKFQINEETGDEEQEDPEVSVDSSGNFVVVWSDEKNGDWDIYGQRYTGEGVAIGNNFRVNSDESGELQYWPQTDCYKNGEFLVSWIDQRDGVDYDIYAQYFNNDGTPRGDNFQVNTDTDAAFQLRPDIKFKENGDYIITWEDKRNGDWDIYFQQFYNNGTPYGENRKTGGSLTGSNQRNAYVSTDTTGSFVICWEDTRNDYSDIFAERFHPDGSAAGECFIVNTDSVDCYNYYSTIAGDKTGNFIIAWEDHRFGFNGEIFAQYFENDGTPSEENFGINDDYGSENQKSPSIASDSSGNFVITWTDYRNIYEDIFCQRYLSDGAPIGQNFMINDDTLNVAQWSSDVDMDPAGNFVVAWEDFRDNYYMGLIYAQRFTAQGEPAGGNFRVSYLGGAIHYSPDVMCRNDGSFLITWADSDEGALNNDKRERKTGREEYYQLFSDDLLTDEPDIWAQLFSAEGVPVGANFRVNDDIPSYQKNPSAASDSAGNFIIVWSDDRSGNDEIFFQRYDKNGIAVDSNIVVQTDIFSMDKARPSVGCDLSGNFVIVWSDSRNGKSEITGQRFSKDGTQLGNNFRVNSDTADVYHVMPKISVNDEGNFIVIWQDDHSGNDELYARKFLSGGEPLGAAYRVAGADEGIRSEGSVSLGKKRIFCAWQDTRNINAGYDIWANVKDWVRISSNEDDDQNIIPNTARLYQNYPNPFNPETVIRYELASADKVEISIYNIIGERVKVLVNKEEEQGEHSVRWNGKNESGYHVSSGVYFYMLKTSAKRIVQKMILLR